MDGGWRRGKGRNPLVCVGKRLPAGFGTKEPLAGVELDLAEPREVAALTGDGRGDGARWLERRPEVERERELAGRGG